MAENGFGNKLNYNTGHPDGSSSLLYFIKNKPHKWGLFYFYCLIFFFVRQFIGRAGS